MTYRDALSLVTRRDQAIERQTDGGWDLVTAPPRSLFVHGAAVSAPIRSDYLGGADFRDCYDTRY